MTHITSKKLLAVVTVSSFLGIAHPVSATDLTFARVKQCTYDVKVPNNKESAKILDQREAASKVGIQASPGDYALLRSTPDGLVNVSSKVVSEKMKSKKNKPSHTQVGVDWVTSNADSRAAIGFTNVKSSGGGALQIFGLQLSAPVAKSGDTELLGLSGFSSDIKLKVSASSFSKVLSSNQGAEAGNMRQRMVTAIKQDKIRICNASDDKSCTKFITNLTANYVILGQNCSDDIINEPFVSLIRQPSFFYGGSASLGYKSFSYKNPLDQSAQSEDKTPWSLEAFGGMYNKERTRMYSAGFTHVQNYKAADAVTICQPPQPDGTMVCKSEKFAGPSKKNKEIIFAEVRQLINKPFVKAVSLKLSYDFEDNKAEIDAPIYLFSDAKGNLNGGVRLGWKEGNDSLLFGVFVGSAFSID